MDAEEFRVRGKDLVDYIADYLENIRSRRVFPDKEPGFLRDQIPENAPIEGETWAKIFADVENIIMPGVTHWQSPHMHAYFPALTSYPSMLGEMLSNAINCLGFTWASSPACTELEIIVMNWLGKMIGLPEKFLHKKNSNGGGVIQTTSSEATLVSLLAGRWQAIQKYRNLFPELEKSEIAGKLVAYCSDQAHSSVEKAALIGLVHIRYIESDQDLSMRGHRLQDAIKKDRELGFIPFWVCATLGTTGSCAFDNLDEIAGVCHQEFLWLHVDAAYAGSAFICPEYRSWLRGIEHANSIAFNPSKWLMVHFDCTAMWVHDSIALHKAFNVDPIYLQHEFSGLAIDFMHWQIPLSKRFRALKLWFVIRNYGITGLQTHIRKSVHLAENFELFVRSDNRFEIPARRYLGMVVLRLIGDNTVTEILLKRLNSRGKIHCVPANLKGKYVIRFTITSQRTTIEDVENDWKEIQIVATEVLKEYDYYNHRAKIALADTKKNEHFGTSLLLSNSPMSPKIVNSSFAAIYDHSDILAEFSKTTRLRKEAQNSPAMKRRIKGILISGKQFSLDSRLDLFHGMEAQSPSSRELSPLEDKTENDDLSEGTPSKSRSRSLEYHENVSAMAQNICHKCGHEILHED